MRNWIFSVKAAVICVAIVLAPACGKPSLPTINGIKGPFFNIVDGKILITMKFLNFNLDAGARFPLQMVHNDMKHSSIEFAPNFEDGGMMLSLYADTDDLENLDIGIGEGNTLPDGRPVPGIPGGEIKNSLRIDTEFRVGSTNLAPSFFFHKTYFGIWMPFGFETAGLSGYWNIYLKNRNVAMLSLVGNDNEGRKAGGLLLLRLDNLKDKQLQNLIRESKRNPYRIY